MIANVAATLNASRLSKVLTYHVLSGVVLSADLTDARSVSTVNSEQYNIDLGGSMPTGTDAPGGSLNIVLTDVQAKNGIIPFILYNAVYNLYIARWVNMQY